MAIYVYIYGYICTWQYICNIYGHVYIYIYIYQDFFGPFGGVLNISRYFGPFGFVVNISRYFRFSKVVDLAESFKMS